MSAGLWAIQLLSQITPPVPSYAYTRPFIQPLPVWNYWWALLIPLLAAICVVYKSIKCAHIREVPWDAFVMMLWIIAALICSAAGLLVLVRVMQ